MKSREWTPEEFRAWAKTRKDPAGDISGKPQASPSQAPKKPGGDSCKLELYSMVEVILKLTPVREFYFAKPRRYRFDLAFPELKVAIEYEGLFSERSGHTTKSGYSDNCSKYNSAILLGWSVLRYTALNYKEVLLDLPILLEQKRIKTE